MELPGRTRVETLKVGKATRRNYLTCLLLLAGWGLGLALAPNEPAPGLSLSDALSFLKSLEGTDRVLDEICAEWIDAMHWAGTHSGLGGRLSSALAWLLPRHQRTGAGHLPRLMQARTSSARRAPGLTRLPFPEEIAMALLMVVAYLLKNRGMPLDPAVMLALAFHCYLRPGELLRIQWRFVALGRGRHRGQFAVTLHPSELCRASKTGEFDETCMVELPWLVKALTLLKARRDPHALLVPVTGLALARLFQDAQELLGLPRILGRQTLYVLRHSGASADMWARRRSLAAIQHRGRWEAPSSVRRYEKGGRVPERLSRCGASLLQFADLSASRIGSVLCGASLPCKPP